MIVRVSLCSPVAQRSVAVEAYLDQRNRYALWKGGDELTKVIVGSQR